MKKIETDIFLVGAGIMSTTLASLLTKLGKTKHKIIISERLSNSGLESSDTLNNAGTGHAGYCELNYTPLVNDKIDISRALKINKAFKQSEVFWDYLINEGDIKDDFMCKMPHISFVTDIMDSMFLKLRFNKLSKTETFKDKMVFSNNPEEIKEWIPLMMENRKYNTIAATKVDEGLEVDYGKLSRYLSEYLIKKGVTINYNEEVTDVYKENDKWIVTQKNLITGEKTQITTKYLFVGAGGGSVRLLTKSGIPEIKGYGGFPVSGEWFVCQNPEIVSQHFAKVYGKPNAGSPPMTAPHLDMRIINGKKSLLFGPYAVATTKLLKFGSWADLFKSINLNNISTILSAGFKNTVLIKYLLTEVFKTKKSKFKELLKFYPNAVESDWELITAGQRVQVIKNKDGKSLIQFDTEIVMSEDSTIAGLLGASPGASTSVNIMLDLINKNFGGEKIKIKIPKTKKLIEGDNK
jgi:malate dehydrogenase (quinone)